MNSCLGIFDSGVGGFTVLRQVVKTYGDVPCVYIADTARAPYGEKSPGEIRLIAEEVVQWLSEKNVSALLVACNTTNSLALDVVKKISNLPVLGLIQAAAEMIYEDRVGVLATSATVSSLAYTKEILLNKPNTFIVEQACPKLVPLIESGNLDTDESRKLIHEYLRPLLAAKVQAIIFGCSHYPLLEPLIQELLPKNIRMIDPAVGLSSNISKVTGLNKVPNDIKLSYRNTRVYTTSSPNTFAFRAVQWLGEIPSVELISLRSKSCFF